MFLLPLHTSDQWPPFTRLEPGHPLPPAGAPAHQRGSSTQSNTQGAGAQLFVSAADVNLIVTGNTPINATLSGGTLSLTFVDATLSLTATLHQGTQSQYRSACNHLTPRAS